MIIEVSDDGAGIDLSAVKRRPSKHGLITADLARDMTDQDAIDLIFLPGFSTAKEVTSHLGPRRRHGRGADEHRENRRQGHASSEPGRGTTLRSESR